MDRDIVQALVKAVELKDLSTAAHTWRVALYTMALAESLGFDRECTERFIKAAVLHDVGKIDIPQSILGKPGRLTDEEYAVVKTHTTLGHERLLRMGETDSLVLGLVRSHHERIDGSGYPDGLSGEVISEAARLFAVIDSFDAMTSLRPYRESVDPQEAEAALRSIEACRTWYCPHAVDTFATLFRSGSIDWILRYFNDADSFGSADVLPDRASLDEAKRRLTTAPEIIVNAGPLSDHREQSRRRG